MSTDSPTRGWWSLSKASGNKEIRQSHIEDKRPQNVAKPSGLKSIAVAIGLKSKRPSKEPLSPVNSLVGSQTSYTTSGPPSSTHSPVDSLGQHDTRLRKPRQSLLTLADDPFAGHPPIVFNLHRSPVPSHLSAHSSTSVSDLVSRKTDSPFYRSSYASSSTNSNSIGPDLNWTNSHHALPESKKLHLKRSIGSMKVNLPNDLSRQTSLMSATSSSPATEKTQPAHDEAPIRPKMRPRGMTVGELPQKSSFFVKEQTRQRKLSRTPSTSNIISASVSPPEPLSKPRVIVRQTSFSSTRVFAPPTAPPTVGLPAPPQTIQEQLDFRQRKGLNSLPSSSSSLSLVEDSMTFFDPVHDSQSSKQHSPEDSFGESVELSPKTALSSPRTLKKYPSQRCLRRAASPSSTISCRTTPTPDPSENRKQRNSHQSRLPMPTLSLSIRTSLVSTPLRPRNGDPTSPSSINEQRKSRRRLFSSSSQRPSTSTCVPADPVEEDTSSVLTLHSDHDTIRTPYKPWAVTRNYPKPSSFWDEGSDTTPSSPAASNVDYQPQAIMSRDELAKLDATTSSSPPISKGLEVSEPEPGRDGLFPPSSTKHGRNSVRSNDSTLVDSNSRSGSPRRPVTADPIVRSGGNEAEITENRRRVVDASSARLDVIPNSTSLPPPPRRRILSSNSVLSTASTSTTSTLIQSPVERINHSKIKLLDRPNATFTPRQPGTLGSIGLPTAPRSMATSRGKLRTSGVLEKAIHRRSIMRKPSFLEIDGETDPESESEAVEKRDSLFLNMKPPPSTTVTNGLSKTGESFLDLARESFDIVRR